MSAPIRRARAARPRVALLAVAAALVTLLGGCSALLEAAPTPTPQPFPGITGELGRVGVIVTSWTSGDGGCDDPTLSPTAIRFDAEGLDQPTPVHIRIYIFKNREAWERRSADVESCVATWATDPATFELLQVSPYVVAGQGPWPPEFDKAMREGITAAAGTGD
jgi:hypothetical protein